MQVNGVTQMKSELEVTIFLVNHVTMKDKGATWPLSHMCLLLIGDASNKVLCKQKIRLENLLKYFDDHVRYFESLSKLYFSKSEWQLSQYSILHML